MIKSKGRNVTKAQPLLVVNTETNLIPLVRRILLPRDDLQYLYEKNLPTTDVSYNMFYHSKVSQEQQLDKDLFIKTDFYLV